MARRTGKEALMETLLAHNVEYVFGNPGSTEAPFMVAVEGYPKLRYVLGLQEAAVVGMADGYARATGRVGFVNLHIAAGVANGLSGLYNAHRGGTPLVITAGQSDTRLYQEEPAIWANLAEMARPFTKWSTEILHPADVPMVIRRAFKVALEPPTGPVFVSLPMDALDGSDEIEIAGPSPAYRRPRPDAAAVERAAELLAGAKRPMLAVGDRLAQSGGVAEAIALAELLGARVAAVDPAELDFPYDHPLFAGEITPWSPSGRRMLRESDVLLAVGATLFTPFMPGPRDALGGETQLIHLDSNHWQVGRVYPAEVGMVADPKAGLADLLAAVAPRLGSAEREAAERRIAEGRAKQAERAAEFERKARARSQDEPISPLWLARELRDRLPANALLIDEALTTTGPIREAVKPSEPGTFFGHRGGAIGWGCGAAVGAQLARPDRKVVAALGDGSSLYSLQALWTAAHYRVPVTYVICANASYRILKLNLQRYLEEQPAPCEYLGTDIVDPRLDFVSLAAGFGVPGWRAERPEEVGPALEAALGHAGPSLVEVVLDGAV